MTILVTCTGDRVRLFNRLAAEVLPILGDGLKWLIIDDGTQSVPVINNDNVTTLKRVKTEERHTLPHNLQHALPFLKAANPDKIIFIEDDDYYDLEAYIPTMELALEEADVVGLSEHYLYNVSKKSYCHLYDLMTSPLATTAINGTAISALEQAINDSIERKIPYVDSRLWADSRLKQNLIHPHKVLHLGFKQFPYGRKSFTAGQVPHEGYKWYRDYTGSKLMQLIGADGVNEWRPLFRD